MTSLLVSPFQHVARKPPCKELQPYLIPPSQFIFPRALYNKIHHGDGSQWGISVHKVVISFTTKCSLLTEVSRKVPHKGLDWFLRKSIMLVCLYLVFPPSKENMANSQMRYDIRISQLNRERRHVTELCVHIC